MRRHTITALSFVVTASVVAVLSGARPAGAAQARLVPAVCGGWSIVPSPNPSRSEARLTGVAALSSTDVWAVGFWGNNNSAALTLVEHWDGTRWSIVPSPSPGGVLFGDASVLNAVSAISATDIWAVGYFSTAGVTTNRTLIEHWDGTQWSVVPSPNPTMPPPANGQLSGVTALSPTDIWAVGFYNNNALGFLNTLVEHWDGSQWRIVPSANAAAGFDSVLNAVASASAGNVWAVGYYDTISGGAPNRTLTEHWNGARWSVVPSPNRSSVRNVLNAVAVASAGSVWADGYAGVTQPPPRSVSAVASTWSARVAASAGVPSGDTTLTEHWNGTRWSIVSSPNVGTEPDFEGVIAISPNNVWAVGQSYKFNGGTEVLDTLTEQWNGTTWSVVPSPNIGSSENFLDAIVHVPGTGELWAVGFYANASSPFPTLIEHYC